MTQKSAAFDVIILGAGAAGMMCALTAGQRGRRVLLLEHGDKAGAKILISGGGRCNFTNRDVRPERFLSANPAFCRSPLSRYTPGDFIAMVERHGIAYHEKTLGQLFCDGSARAIVAMLLAECAAGGVDVRLGHTILDVTRADHFRVATSGGGFTAPALVLATGGLSIPKMGATGFSLDLAQRFGCHVVPPRPGLVPLTLAEFAGTPVAALAGVALPSLVGLGPRSFRESLLFTHRGLSGPSILQISSYWQPGQSLTLDLAPDRDLAALLVARKRSHPRQQLQRVLAEIVPARLAGALAVGAPVGELANVADKDLAALAHRLQAWPVHPTGSEGYAKAEVMTGGIDTHDIDQKTMAAHGVPSLFAIGEAVDVTGWLGGYNFQWAWSSGWVAGQAV